jgi:death-on-curing protein
LIRYLSVDGVISVHDSIVPCAVINPGLLSSAVMQPRATFDGSELYESVLEKAAVLLRGLALNHAFEDGNKRTAWASTQVFLEANGSPLYQMPDVQAADFVESVVVDGLGVPEITEWLAYRLQL